MKRSFLFVLFMLFALHMFAGTVEINTPDVKIPDNISATISKAIDGIAKGLNIAAPEVWRIMKKQAIVYSITTCIKYLLLIIYIVCLIKYVIWVFTVPDDSSYPRISGTDDDINMTYVSALVVGVGIAVGAVISAVVHLDTFVTAILNPAY